MGLRVKETSEFLRLGVCAALGRWRLREFYIRMHTGYPGGSGSPRGG